MVAAVLATLLILAPVASAADPHEVSFPEDREDLTVATFSASDPDADSDDPEWDLSGPDEKLFEISDDGVLSFKEQPDYEDPKDGDEDDTASGEQGAGDNVYKVTVTALGGDLEVVVTVTNVDEDGSVTFDKPQPQATRPLTAKLDDDDGTDKPVWSWSKSMDKDAADADWMSVSGTSAKRTPAAADVGYYLRATVTYEDSYGMKTISGVTANKVEEETLANARPKFDTIAPLELDENVSGNLGDPILPTDPDGDQMQLALDGTTGDNALFGYNASGQLSVKGEDGLDYEAHVTDSGGARAPHVDDDTTTDDDHIPVGALTFTVKIKATDPSGAVGMADVTVYLKDVNEAPKFGDAAAAANQKTLYIDENDGAPALRTTMAAATQTITYTATDEDGTVGTTAGTTDTVTLSVEGADGKYFSFETDGTTLGAYDEGDDGARGLTGKEELAATDNDYEEKSSYSITIVATSTRGTGDDAVSTYSRLDVTIKVVDGEDDGSASFVGGTRAPLVGRSVVAKVSDPDGGITGPTWQWYRGATKPADAAARTTLIGALRILEDDPEAGTNRVCGDDGNTTDVDATADGSTACVIDGATSPLYTPSAATDNTDVGFTLHALVTYTDARSGTTDVYALASSDGVVQDRNPANTAPVFPDQDPNTAGDQSDTAMRSVAENKEKESVGEPIPANDADTVDNGLLIYTLSGADEANFSVDNGGQIKTKVELDFETQPMHTVVLTATDPSGASDSITVMIEVMDGPDDAVITGVETFSFPEDREDLEIATFSADDPDADAGDPKWELSGPDDDLFEISDDGVLSFKEQPDYEDPKDGDEDDTASGEQGAGDNVYKVTVTALGGDLEVVVTVTNVDEDGSVTFDKPQPQATRPLTAKLDDDDGTDKPVWSWSKSMDKDAADADWMSVSGTSAKRTPAAADVGYYLRATVTYEDSYGMKTISGVTANKVEEETLANARPKFDTIAPLELDENVSGNLGDPILPTDPDGDQMQLALDGTTGDNALFGYNASGQLSVKGEDGLDYEAHVTDSGGARAPHVDDDTTTDDDHIPVGALTFTVKIKATDPSGAVGMADVTVYLKDVNEAPKFGDAAAAANQKTLYIDENDGAPALRTTMAAATQTITYTATDEDGTVGTTAGTTDTVTLSVEGADGKYFSFETDGTTLGAYDEGDDGARGLTGKEELAATDNDYEEKSSYSITIVATSTRGTGDDAVSTYSRLDVTIKVVDGEDDGSASFVGGTRAPLVGRSVVAKVSDPDGGITGPTWQWYRGATKPADAAARTTLIGALRILEDDPEAGTNRVCGDDGNTTDVDATADGSTACVIDGATSPLYTPSAATDNTDVGFTLHALVTYTDARSGTTDVYALASSDGVVQDRNPANTAPVFPDQDPNTAGDQSDTAMRSVAENKEKESVGEPIPANDADTVDNGLLIYTLSGADEANFSVDNGGQIKTKVELDFETQPMHTVVLTATDPSGASDSITVMIEVMDGPDDAVITPNRAPVFDDGETAGREIAENSEAGTAVGAPVAATDADGNDLSYELSGDDAMYFDIDDMGQITVGEGTMLDYESDKTTYMVTVTADDGTGVHNAMTSIAVTIMVTDVNDYSPMFDAETAELMVAENTEAGMAVGDPLIATDLDGEAVTYSLGGDDAMYFAVGEDTGQIAVGEGTMLDYESDKTTYMVTVTADDGTGADNATGSIAVTIMVTNVNDNAPMFDAETAELAVSETTGSGMTIGDAFMATDADGDDLAYTLGGDDAMYFAIDAGQIAVGDGTMLDYESDKMMYMVTVTASDGMHDASIMVTINVENAFPGCTVADNNGLTNDCEALLTSMDALGGSLNWSEDNPLWDWEGVTLTAEEPRRVNSVWLRGKELDGTVPAALARVEMLTVLNLHTNALTGEIPDLSGLALTQLYLSNNMLTGGVPAWLNGETQMTDLWLWNNMLSGSVPDLSGMTGLEQLKLQNNMLDGGVPDGSMLPGNANMILLQSNSLGGNLSDADLSGLSVRTLWLHDNGLTGSIDAAMLPASVTNLNLRENSLSGSIPDLNGLSNLVFLRLGDNDLTGAVPGTLGDLASLEKLQLQNNQLTRIEVGLENAADTLTQLYLSGNTWDAGTCLRGDLADVETNDFDTAGLAACQ